MRAVSVDIDLLTRTYFYFDLPVPYQVENGEVQISPVNLCQSEIFLGSKSILSIDKNLFPDPKIIQMSYLRFICEVLIPEDPTNVQRFLNILLMCLGLKSPEIVFIDGDETNLAIRDKQLGIVINSKHFDDIKRIILYQNIPHYDDSYVNPELQKAMEEEDELKNKYLVVPSLERKMAIVTSHSGVLKSEQQKMTYRAHCALFDEVCGETEFTTIRPIMLLSKEGANMEHWIYKKKKGKYDSYITDVDKYSQSMGGNSAVKTTSSTSTGDLYMQQIENFNK